jgi:hypothetical protein
MMGVTVHVDPTHLHSAAQAQGDVGSYVAGMTNGQSMASSGAGMSGLLSETACQFVGTVLDGAASAAHRELTEHSAKLSKAANRYHQMDEEFGQRLRTFA